MTMPCDICAGTKFQRRLSANDWRTAIAGSFEYVSCEQCGLTQLNPQPSTATLASAYPDWLWRDEITRGRTMPSRVTSTLNVLAAQFSNPETLLDVGCGPGSFLTGARMRGWQTRGIESSSSQVEYCRTNGLDVTFVDDFSTMPDDGMRYSAVTFNHVLEHVPSPVAYLRKAFSLLRPGGRVVVAVPNFDSLSARVFGQYWMHLDAPRHLYQFTPLSLERCVTAAGGRVTAIRPGDRDDNAAGARESLRRCVVHGIFRRPAVAVRASASDEHAPMSLPHRLYRLYGAAMAVFGESIGLADTLIAVTERSQD